jgi:site-specific recombinase XerD
MTNEPALWIKPSSHTKTKIEHRVPLNAYAVQVLKEIKANNDVGEMKLFPNKFGDNPLTHIHRSWVKIRTLANLQNHPEYGTFHMHDIRHSFASFLIQQGVSLYIVGELLGHTKLDTTQRYSHLDTQSMSVGAGQFLDALPDFSLTPRAVDASILSIPGKTE